MLVFSSLGSLIEEHTVVAELIARMPYAQRLRSLDAHATAYHMVVLVSNHAATLPDVPHAHCLHYTHRTILSFLVAVMTLLWHRELVTDTLQPIKHIFPHDETVCRSIVSAVFALGMTIMGMLVYTLNLRDASALEVSGNQASVGCTRNSSAQLEDVTG